MRFHTLRNVLHDNVLMCDQHNHVTECFHIDDCVSWCVSLLCYLVFDSNVGPVLLSDYVSEKRRFERSCHVCLNFNRQRMWSREDGHE